MLQERNKNKMVQRYKLPSEKKKLNSKHNDRVDVDPFLYTRREGIGTTKENKKKETSATMYLLYYAAIGTVKRENKKTNAIMSLLYYVPMVL